MKTDTKNQKRQIASETTQVRALDFSRYTMDDFKNALLLVSVFINLFVFTTWLTMQLTDEYNAVMISFLLR